MSHIPSKAEILQWISDNPTKTSKRDIARAFGIRGAQKIDLKQVFRELEEEGHLTKSKKTYRDPQKLPPVAVLQVAGQTPDGDLTAFLASCRRLAARDDRLYLPGHGAPITDPAGRLAWLLAHRKERENQILATLARAPAPLTIRDLTTQIYTDTDPRLIGAAQRNVFAHLIDLAGRTRVRAEPRLSPDAQFSPGPRADDDTDDEKS